ncbi:MAG: RHS repeat protein [Clostridiales bacterium]|nr:RHS repeat protein [Clostridiales bacterium]
MQTKAWALSDYEYCGHPSFKEYDEDGRLVKLVNEEGAVTKYGYDLKGQLKKVTNALNENTTFTYDSVGRVLRTH